MKARLVLIAATLGLVACGGGLWLAESARLALLVTGVAVCTVVGGVALMLVDWGRSGQAD